jgi:phosphoribosyl 1,2-cyclic phosphodiesterase
MSETGKMTIRFRGVRGSIPAPAQGSMRYGGNTSCVEIRYRDQLLILDAGSGIRLLGNELIQNQQTSPIEATLLLSHSHWDHIQGLPFFAPGYSPKNRITIFGECGRGEQLQLALTSQMRPLHFPVGLDQMRGLQKVRELLPDATKIGNFLVQTTQLNHPGGCTGFRIEGASGHVAYLPDHEPYRSNSVNGEQLANRAQSELIEFVRGADLLILDTQYTADEYSHRLGWGHGCLPDSVQLAIDAGVRRLFLFHHDPTHDDQQLDHMVETARAMAVDSSLIVEAASENEVISVTPSNVGMIPQIGLLPLQPIGRASVTQNSGT